MTVPDHENITALISLGANLPSRHGTPLQTLQKAAEVLRAFSLGPARLSSFWQSEPLDCPPDSPVYTNAMMEIMPLENESPLSLLHRLQQTEQNFGRIRSGMLNEARVLDLDLISFGDEVCSSGELSLPHPRAHKRLFVLMPLQELCPDFRFPGISGSLDNLIKAIDDQSLTRVPLP